MPGSKRTSPKQPKAVSKMSSAVAPDSQREDPGCFMLAKIRQRVFRPEFFGLLHELRATLRRARCHECAMLRKA